MSGSNNEVENTGGPASSAEPSMEEILASIRRILKDDQPGAQSEAEEDILVLDSTMVVKPGTGASAPAEPPPAPQSYHEPAYQEPAYHEPEPSEASTAPGLVDPTFEDELQSHSYTSPELSGDADLPTAPPEPANYYNEAEAPAAHNAKEEQNMSDDAQGNVHAPDGLVGDAASDAAAGSIGALIRTISSDRQIAVGRANLTLEDLVREELRPLLKAWLDTNLPALVERIVRAEIQRVIERSGV
jgi:cell pole-organizing protein PopZ